MTIALYALILGGVKISKLCYIGSNSTILPEKVIGKNVIIGVSAVVTKDVKENTTVVEVPAGEIQKG